MPAYTGFVRIATINGKADTAFTDDNNGEGLVQGIDYCYMVTAYYKTEVKVLLLNETCNSLVPGFPALLNVSVTNIDDATGSIFVSWAKPRNFDIVSAPGPYVFRIYRSDNAKSWLILC